MNIRILDVIFFFVLATILGVFVVLRVSQKDQWVNARVILSSDDWWWKGSPPQYWYVDGMRPGLQSLNTFGQPIAEITNVKVFDVGADNKFGYIDLKLKTKYNKKQQQYYFNNKPLQVGKSLDLLLGKNNVHGLVAYIDGLPSLTEKKHIEVKLRLRSAVTSEVASSYQVGLQQKDSLGNIISEVTSVKTDIAQFPQFSDIRGTYIITSNPSLRDVTLELDVATFSSDGVVHALNGGAVKLGERLWFQFPTTVVRDAEITKIY